MLVRFGSITVITSDIRLTPSLSSTVVTPVAESRHAGEISQTRREGDTIGTGKGSTPYTNNNYPDLNRMAQVT